MYVQLVSMFFMAELILSSTNVKYLFVLNKIFNYKFYM